MGSYIVMQIEGPLQPKAISLSAQYYMSSSQTHPSRTFPGLQENWLMARALREVLRRATQSIQSI